MKKLIIIFLFFSTLCFSQRLQNFHLNLTHTIVTAKFTVAAGSSCNGYNVLHSTDSLNYTTIYNFPGICGNITKAEDFSFNHHSPTFNTNNFYKIELISLETSISQKIFVAEPPKKNIIVYPNPITNYSDKINLRVAKANNTYLSGFLFNQDGKPVRKLDFTTVFDYSYFYLNELENGLFVLWLTDGFSVYTTKFTVLR